MNGLSVILCTHAPRVEYLARVLHSLQDQTLDMGRWELLIVDNASTTGLLQKKEFSWPANTRFLNEEVLGLMHARRRGQANARHDILVFVDDDNVLDPAYLKTALELFESNPRLGCVSGCIRPEYEQAPPPWFRGEYESWIAVRRIDKDWISNFRSERSEPCGAGMVVRRVILDKLFEDWSDTGLVLGRSGSSLLSGEDVEISGAALRCGYFIGQIQSLQLTHLISARRTDSAYLFRLYRNICASGRLLAWKSGGKKPQLSAREFFKDVSVMVFGRGVRRRLAWERFRSFSLAKGVIGRCHQSTATSS